MRNGDGVLEAIAMWSMTGPVGDMPLVLIRATVLLSGAMAVAWWLRRGKAHARHLLWTTTFVLLLGLPAAAVWLPPLEVPMLPDASVQVPSPSLVALAPTMHPTRAAPPESAPFEAAPLEASPVEAELAALPLQGGRSSGLDREVGPLYRLGSILLGFWALGVLGGLGSLTVGVMRFRRLVRRARPIRDASVLAKARAIQSRLGVEDDVRFLTSSEATTPMAGGVRRPVVLLPPGALQWSDARLEVVLTHELVHVLRRDTLRHMIGCMALAVYWFHPLSWVASRLAMSSREQACDEEVVALGTLPSEYARHLLDLVEGLKPGTRALSLSMVQRSQLERRVMSILESNQRTRNSLVTSLILVAFCAFGVTAAVAIPVALQTPPLAPASAVPASAAIATVPPAPGPVPPAPPTAVAPSFAPELFFQDGPTCRMEGRSGSFSGTMSTAGGRTEHVGWHNGDRAIQKYIDDLRLCYRIRGDVVLADDGIGVRAMGAESWVVLEAEGDELQRLVIVEGPEGLDFGWSVDGIDRPFDGEAREWHDRMFSVLGAYWEASQVRGEESRLKGQISSMKGHVSSLKGQISSHRGHVSSLKGRISSHRGHVSSLKGRISSNRGHVSSLKGQISSIQGQMSSLRSSARIVEDPDTRSGLQRQMEEHQARIADIQAEIEAFALDERVEGIQGQIQDYDLEAQVQDLEREIEAYDLESRVQALTQEIEDYRLEARIQEKMQEIEALDADRRAADIEAAIAPEVDALLRLIRGL